MLGATASCLAKVGVVSVAVSAPSSTTAGVAAVYSPVDWFRTEVCERRPWMVDLDVTILRGVHRVLGDLMVHRGINLMKAFRSIRDVHEAAMLHLGLFEVDYCRALSLPLRLLCLVGMVVANACMVATLLRGMKESGTVAGVALSTASNFVTSALYGAAVWGEAMNGTWWVGFVCVLAGVTILSAVQPPPADGVKDAWGTGESPNQNAKIRIIQTTAKFTVTVQGRPAGSAAKKGNSGASLASPVPADRGGTQNPVASLGGAAFAGRRPFTPVTPSPRGGRFSTTKSEAPVAEGSVLTKPASSVTVKTKGELKPESELAQYHPPHLGAGIPCRPLRTPLVDRSFANECALCGGVPLFDVTTGRSVPDDGYASVADLAPLTCFHVFHAKCLKQASKAYKNACPLCAKPLAMWHAAGQAASLPGFWLSRVEECLRTVVPNNAEAAPPDDDDRGKQQQPPPAAPSPPTSCLPASVLRGYFRQDPTLTEEQRAYIQDDPSGMGRGLQVALEWGGYRDYNDVPKGHAGFAKGLRTRGIWRYDPQRDDVWLWEWGPVHPQQRCDQCQLVIRPLPVQCEGCRGSAEAAFYCSETCAKRDWQRHRQTCQTWRERGPKG